MSNKGYIGLCTVQTQKTKTKLKSLMKLYFIIKIIKFVFISCMLTKYTYLQF